MYAIVFSAIFLIVAAGLISLSLSQQKLTNKKVARELALHIAEAGVNYYRWHLAHDPEDYQDGTGLPGPYVHNYDDPLGGTVGQFSLEITPPDQYSNTVTIKSTGWTLAEPNAQRVIEVQYGRPSLARYSFLTNSNVWFGDSEELHGVIHSNGGIRMDGEHDSLVVSAKETYICGPEHGCAGDGEPKPGVWGSGGDPLLWQFPASNIDFNAVTVDLATLKNQATSTGVFLPASGLGYHVVFKADASFDLYQVDQLRSPVWGYNGSHWVNESNDIQNETFVQNYSLNPTSTIIFIEDDVWVDGTVNGRVTLATAVLPDIPSTNTKAIISGNILYTAKDGSDTLGIIAQKDVLVPLYMAPDNLEVDAVLLAQNGHVFRYYYPNWYPPEYLRTKIELYGGIITNTIWTWSWVNSSQTVVSGYQNTETTYDPFLLFAPPPSFPLTSEYRFLKWEDISDQE